MSEFFPIIWYELKQKLLKSPDFVCERTQFSGHHTLGGYVEKPHHNRDIIRFTMKHFRVVFRRTKVFSSEDNFCNTVLALA